MSKTLTYEQRVAAPAAVVYQHFAEALALEDWFADVVEMPTATEGGIYLMRWSQGHYAVGTIEALTPDALVRWRWHGRDEPGYTTVDVRLSEVDGVTTAAVTHSGFGDDEAWAASMAAIDAGWKGALANLASVIERGIDKRIYDRPMLGVFVAGPIDAERAAKLGVPVSEGVEINGTLDGMGAQQAGLQDGDVIVGLNGKPIVDFSSFGPALSGKIGGDNVEVVFYRGAEQHAVTMALGKRAEPPHFATAAALAERVASVFEGTNRELDALLDGVTEAAASAHPAEGEWSVKETLAHLILNQHYDQQFVVSRVRGFQFAGAENHQPWQASIARQRTLTELVSDLKRAQQTTVDLLASLDDAFVANRGAFMAVVQTVDIEPHHHNEHFAQIRAALDAAAG